MDLMTFKLSLGAFRKHFAIPWFFVFLSSLECFPHIAINLTLEGGDFEVFSTYVGANVVTLQIPCSKFTSLRHIVHGLLSSRKNNKTHKTR